MVKTNLKPVRFLATRPILFDNQNKEFCMNTIPRKLVIGALYLVIGLWITTATLWAADPFVGTWKLNLAKSKYSPGPPPKNVTITYEATENGIRATTEGINAEGKPIATTYSATYDGTDVPVTGTGAPYDTIALKRINPNSVELTTKKDGKVVGKGKRVVSKDGKILTVTTKGTSAKGEPTNNVAVYEKQ
jgi:hypothetical protein